MARADSFQSPVVWFADSVPADGMSGWMIWNLVILGGFVILTLLTGLFILSRSGFWERIRDKRKLQRKKSRKKPSRKALRGSGSASSRERTVRKRKTGASVSRSKKAYTGKARRKKTGQRKPLKMPFLPDPSMIRSYTKKYLIGQKVKANWERLSLEGTDSGENLLSLEVYLLTNEFQWAPARSDAILHRGKTVKPSRYLGNKALKQALSKAGALVSVGLTTELADGENPPGLARERAERMVSWLKQVMPRLAVDYLLILDSPRNIRGSVDEEDSKVDEKRSVLWICLQEPPDHVNVEEALRDALSAAINLPFDFDIYHDVSLEKTEAS